ncbi:hypothetical protein J1G44_11715 [Cellulomonas sp. zg-ZUI199]|uniref:ATP-binding protein n=1 Tax=Cellulomonas wangleii TaxID=2816956 RepID=A0ABX8D7P7_9CELL|nr:hypothetical protein [Cellulomonas wangleii]MBO0925144.1 hypothetical protein [Cellulomonas wangleii]QVI63449.1 hypothetical protein KG103_06145 [Cellulomonas wangleii]
MALTPINRALNQIPKRAEKRESVHLHETFVDSGIADVLDAIDHQVLNGRRGTGKTHALTYLAAHRRGEGDIAVYLDLRTIGSPDGILGAGPATVTERAANLLVDLLGQMRESLLNAVMADDSMLDDEQLIEKMDELLAAMTSVRVAGEIQIDREDESTSARKRGGHLSGKLAPAPSLEVRVEAAGETAERTVLRETRRGSERLALNFSELSQALRELGTALGRRRVWLLLDEWTSVPRDVQPYLAAFLVRCVLPQQRFTVKIAAIEQQANWRQEVDGQMVGIELGADMSGSLTLDDFMVFESNEDRSRSFFLGLLFKHLTSRGDDVVQVDGLKDTSDVVRLGFTDTRAFDELVRAAEGVPRDALHIAADAARKAGEAKISVPLVREAARAWYQSDKVRPIESREESKSLLNWIIEKVIRQKRARAFLVSERDSRDPLLLSLFDARVLHVVRRGYSSQDHPGERYEVWVIDYGAYVDLIQTKNAILGDLLFGENDEFAEYFKLSPIEVPKQDLRAIRRAILDLSEFYAKRV